MNRMSVRPVALIGQIAAATGLLGQPALSRPAAVPVEPVSAILEAFRTHQIVAISDVHGNDQAHAMLLSLIRDPRFPAIVDDIVVESGNALYQDVMDRFVNGEDVPYSSLRKVWHQTTVLSGVSDRPMYEERFRTVREVNALLQPDRRIRILLGDPPVDWDATPVRYQEMLRQRESYPVEVIRREVLGKKHRALVVYGGFHLLRRGDGSLPTRLLRETLIGRLERTAGIKTFTVWRGSTSQIQRLQSDAGSWAAPTLALLAGTLMGAAPYALVGGPVYELNPFAVR